ncbi:MAG TPA: Ty1/Copia family ribonuclease HI [Chlamydiales bacterium]|nr:Ty1/Copia family ribonuclease HI [Chlamydiales bacterium]
MLHTRVKHIDINYHFLRERVQSKEVSLSYVRSKENIADIFTKPLEKHQFIKLRDYLGVKAGGVTREEHHKKSSAPTCAFRRHIA